MAVIGQLCRLETLQLTSQMTNLLLFDSHPIIRRGLKELLKDLEEEFTFYEAGSVTSLKKILAQHPIDLIVAGLNERSKIDGPLISKHSSIPWVLMYGDEMYQSALLLTVSGAMGCISKRACAEETKRCFTEVLHSNVFVCSSTLKKFGHEYLFDAQSRNFLKTFLHLGVREKQENLTTREKEIALLLLKGLRTSEIALALNLKQSTISTIKKNIFLKKNVRNVVELATVLPN